MPVYAVGDDERTNGFRNDARTATQNRIAILINPVVKLIFSFDVAFCTTRAYLELVLSVAATGRASPDVVPVAYTGKARRKPTL